MVRQKRYAQTGWTKNDVQDLFDVSDKEAEDFLVKHQKHVRNAMINAGWTALETCGLMDGLPLTEDEADVQEA